MEGRDQRIGSPAAHAGHGEARRHYRPRLKLRWPVRFVIVDPRRPSAPEVAATTHGISIGGAYIESSAAVRIGTMLDTWLHPPPVRTIATALPSSIRLAAKIEWVNEASAAGNLPRGFGVSFCALTAADELALHAYFSDARARA